MIAILTLIVATLSLVILCATCWMMWSLLTEDDEINRRS